MNYTGWLGVKGHKHARPHDPEATRAFNQAVYEQEQKKAALSNGTKKAAKK